jgi:hypothetical protein
MGRDTLAEVCPVKQDLVHGDLEASVSSPVEDRPKTRVRAVRAQRKASGARYLGFPAWVADPFAT